ncbi:MAG TPA: IS481 family transposase [Solirubrobacteraceae bacterium]|nr:IS481 family transposase [Solirubrobacteraceae bacterium]
MYLHANAKLGLAGRLALVAAIEDGCSLKAAAAAFSVSPATAHRWWHRWLDGGREPSSLLDRSSRPHRSPRQLADELAERICECRRKTGWGPRLVAGATGFCHSTVWKVLRRAGISRPPRPAREPTNRYEWPCPGDLLHMDVSEYARFERPGWRVTGDRSSQDRQHIDGVDYVHAIVDDHSRLAYAEVHSDQKAATAAGFLERALRFYAAHGIVAKRLMTDNAWIYVKSHEFRRLLDHNQIRHLTIKPYRPRTNGKVERFHQTMGREWAYGLIYRSHRERAAALPHWLGHYNTARPHSSLGGRPPISRVHNVRRQDN